jgi:hypothetical protein
MTKNWNCDGEHCANAAGQVRVYPLGGGANLILCMSCAAHENRYRQQRANETGRQADWPQVNWFNCEVYGEQQ